MYNFSSICVTTLYSCNLDWFLCYHYDCLLLLLLLSLLSLFFFLALIWLSLLIYSSFISPLIYLQDIWRPRTSKVRSWKCKSKSQPTASARWLALRPSRMCLWRWSACSPVSQPTRKRRRAGRTLCASASKRLHFHIETLQPERWSRGYDFVCAFFVTPFLFCGVAFF